MWFIAKKASQQNSSKVSQAEEDSLAFWYICLQLISIYLKCKIQPKMSQAEKNLLALWYICVQALGAFYQLPVHLVQLYDHSEIWSIW